MNQEMRTDLPTSMNSRTGATGADAVGAVAPQRGGTSSRRTAQSWFRRLAAVTVASTLGMAGLAPLTEAATTTYSLTSLSAQVNGNDVSTNVTVAASSTTVAQKLKVCVRNASQANLDYAGQVDATLTTTGTSVTEVKRFSVGRYTYWACLKVADRWYEVGTKKTFDVVPEVVTPTMPTTSTKPGWAYSYGQDFTTAAPLGEFSKVYGSKWAGYYGTNNDTSRNGSYRPDKVLSVADGMLDMSLGYDAATGLYNVAAPFPQPPAGVNGGSSEYTGMRYSIRFKSSNAMAGYKVAWMLWPSSWKWDDGEIDFPEASLDGNIWAFSHKANVGRPQENAMWAKSPATFYDGWHTATTEWVPGKSVEVFLDGASIGKTTQYVPTKPMHLALQTETALSSTPPAKSVSGHISVDWLTVESYQP